MLVLTRWLGESIMIGDNIKVTVVDIDGKTVKLGVDAPMTVSVFPEEIYLDMLDKKNTLDAQMEAVRRAMRLFHAGTKGRDRKEEK